MKLLAKSLLILTLFILSSCCATNALGRSSLMVYPKDKLYNEAVKSYAEVKKKSKVSKNNRHRMIVDRVTQRLVKIAERDYPNFCKGFKWEVVLLEEPETLNAWCMPGGKMAVYTGILEVTKNKHGLAAVMGHEIAHAVAKHSIERASRSMVINVGTQIADIASGGKISGASRAAGVDVAGMLAHFGINNPFNRKQESEADYLGLIFASLSGFDIRETIEVWKRMKEANKGKEPPEWMSTHPSSSRRIEALKTWIPEIILDYPPISNLG